MNKKIAFSSAVLAAAPFLALADAPTKNLNDLVSKITGYLNQALVLLMGIAIVIFVWQVIQYFVKPDTEKKDAANYVMYSVIGFFVILSVWGLVNILRNTFGLEGSAPSASELNSLFPGGNGSGSTPNMFNGGGIGGGTFIQTPVNNTGIGGGTFIQTPAPQQSAGSSGNAAPAGYQSPEDINLNSGGGSDTSGSGSSGSGKLVSPRMQQ